MPQTSLQESLYQHIPVMVNEVLDLLITNPHGIYLDGTVGLGGHATHILNTLSESGRLIGFDRDEKALALCAERLSSSRAFSSYNTSYDTFPKTLKLQGFRAVNGILLDLGLSSYQLNDAARGFAFQSEGKLDMRFDTSSGLTAAELIESVDSGELADIIYKNSQERFARRIARLMKKTSPMKSIQDLKEAVRRSTPPKNRHKTLARVFQALRIEVNNELDRLQNFLDHFIDFIVPGGRIVILSYHSLEDRKVKQSFKKLANENVLSILTKKPLTPTKEEHDNNRRSRSAKLRAGEKI